MEQQPLWTNSAAGDWFRRGDQDKIYSRLAATLAVNDSHPFSIPKANKVYVNRGERIHASEGTAERTENISTSPWILAVPFKAET